MRKEGKGVLGRRNFMGAEPKAGRTLAGPRGWGKVRVVIAERGGWGVRQQEMETWRR